MKPKKLERSNTDDLFRNRLDNIIDLEHPLVRLAHETDWAFFEAAIEPLYAENGRPGVPVNWSSVSITGLSPASPMSRA